MNEFIDKIGAFWIIRQKLDDVHNDIRYALEFFADDNNDNSNYWRKYISGLYPILKSALKKLRALLTAFYAS